MPNYRLRVPQLRASDLYWKRLAPRVAHRPELGLDTQQLVVLCDAVRARQRAGLDLRGGGGDGDVGDGAVLGLAGAVRYHRGVVRLVGHVDALERLGERADLVRLDEDGVGDVLADRLTENPGIGDEHVITDQLQGLAKCLGNLCPTVPVRLAHTVLDADDRVAGAEVREIRGELRRGEAALLAGELVAAVAEELRAGDVQPQVDVVSGAVAGPLDRLQNQAESRLVRLEARSESTLIADRRRQAARGQQLSQRVKYLDAVAQRLAETRSPDREDHELLDIEAVVRVRAAVDDVHHRHRHYQIGRASAELREVAVERQARVGGGRTRGGERHPEDGVGAEPALVLRAIELDHAAIDRCLRAGILAEERLPERRVDVLDGPQHALAAVALLVAVAQLDRLARAGGRARGYGCPPLHARVENHVHLDGGITARVEDLASADVSDAAHQGASFDVYSGQRARPAALQQ